MTSPLKVNFTDQEATSKPREVLPTGEYVCNIVEATDAEVKPGKKNSGKPFWKLQFRVQEGKFIDAPIYSTVMLFEGALYSLSQLMTALNREVTSGEFTVPETEWLLGQTVIVTGVKRPEATIGGQDLPERFEVKGYKPVNSGLKKSSGSSLLP